MELGILEDKGLAKGKITTVKLSAVTKKRLDIFRLHHRESYEEIVERILEILNICRVNPEKARIRLAIIEKDRKRNKSLISRG